MLSFEEAKKKAKKLNPKIDNCTEYEDAFVFGDSKSVNFGDEPIVVLKKNGRIIWMTAYLDGDGELVELNHWDNI